MDAHTVGPDDYEEPPEFTDATMVRADHQVGGRLVRRGRPPEGDAKEAVSMRLPSAGLAYFRSSGPGWQTRIDDILSKVVEAEGAQIEDANRSVGDTRNGTIHK